MTNIKIAVVCSPGGHFTEMSMLADIFGDNPAFLVSHREKFSNTLKGVHREYLIPNVIVGSVHANKLLKKALLVMHMLIITAYETYIFFKERPDLIISTGSEIAIPIFLLGSIFKTHTIFIESITRINDISSTGKIVYRFADMFIVQHERLLKGYPRAVYRGSVI